LVKKLLTNRLEANWSRRDTLAISVAWRFGRLKLKAVPTADLGSAPLPENPMTAIVDLWNWKMITTALAKKNCNEMIGLAALAAQQMEQKAATTSYI